MARKIRNVLRALLQVYGPRTLKRYLWNSEFSRGRWDCLDSTASDCVYPSVEKYAARGSILDLGCGSGSTGNELDATAYGDYTGVDISDVAIEKARGRTEQNRRAAKNRYVQSDIVDYVPTRQFDVILFRDSIYYIEVGKIKAMLDRYAGSLTPRGVFIVRIAGETEKSRRELDIIERNFDVVERQLFHEPTAIVIVFRPRRR
jgi:2-polyprenyl-6-hydroxyphenyl methylase/3-demethylubiquinone-9 3-methyltransferase